MIKLGFEFETSYNSDIIQYSRGDYHSDNWITKYWKLERDGSLSVMTNDFPAKTGEFVSKTLSLQNWRKAIQELKEVIAKNQEFYKVFDVNKTCGFHIHFSDDNINMLNLKEKVFLHSFKAMRKYFFRNLEKQGLRKELVESIKKNYDRYYAKRLTMKRYYIDGPRSDRYREFNLRKSGTIEWRAFNMVGVRTWQEFKDLLELAVKSIKYFFRIVKKQREILWLDFRDFFERIIEENNNYIVKIDFDKDESEKIIVKMNIEKEEDKIIIKG